MNRALLVAAVTCGACGSNAPPAGPSHKAAAPTYEASLDDVLGFLPADSEIVVAINAAQVRKSAVWAQIGAKVEHVFGDDLAQLRTACNFDPLQTVERVSIGLRVVEQERMVGVVVVRGVGAGTIGCVRTHFGKGGDAIDDQGTIILGHSGDRLRSAWTVIGSSLIVQIDETVSHATMQQVLASGSPLRTSREFMQLVGRIDRGASVWGMINGKTKLLDDAAGAGMRPTTVQGTLMVSDRIVLAARAVFPTADQAAKVDALIKQSLAMAGKFTEHAESRQEDRQVIVGLSIAGAQLAQLLGMF